MAAFSTKTDEGVRWLSPSLAITVSDVDRPSEVTRFTAHEVTVSECRFSTSLTDPYAKRSHHHSRVMFRAFCLDDRSSRTQISSHHAWLNSAKSYSGMEISSNTVSFRADLATLGIHSLLAER
jgi:hypothetical protein